MSTTGDEVGIFIAELAGSDFAVIIENFLREGWVFEGPEHEQTSFSRFIALTDVLVTNSQ